MTQPFFKVENLTRIFGTGASQNIAVNNVSFEVEPGEIIAIVGESGSGKSTLARMLLCLDSPTSGSITLNGTQFSRNSSSRSLKAYWRDVQGVFQNPIASFNQFYSVGTVLRHTFNLQEKRMSKSEQEQKIADALRLVGLEPEHTLDRAAHELSGGQLQRAIIARALLVDPRLLIADESTSALDASLRVTILNVLKDLSDRLNLSVLFITHDIGQAYYLADRVFVMFRGEMVEQGITTKVLQHPQHDYTRRLLADVPRLGGWAAVPKDTSIEELAKSIT